MDQDYRHLPKPPAWDNEFAPPDKDENAWLIIYLDVMTLILCLFVVLLAYSTYAEEDYAVLTKTISNPVAVQGKVAAPIAPELQRENEEAAISKPAELEADRLREQFRQALFDQNLEQSVELEVDKNKINLQISERILFGLGQADLELSGQTVLQKIVPLLSQAEEHQISIEGHTDTVAIANERFPSNWELSTQRATTVLRFLLTQGIEAERMRAIGYAATRPIADNATEAGREKNRRVALVLHLADE